MQKPTTDILERIKLNSSAHKDGVYTRLYRYLLREDIYYLAYQKLYSNSGAATKGTDGDTADGFGGKYVASLISDLKNGTYTPKPVRRKYIKKSNGKMRPLGIPSFRDKLLQEVIRSFLEAIYEPIFSEHSHGFRPGKSCHTALIQAKNHFRGTRWFIEGDIKGCFDNIDHAKLIEILSNKIKDSKFINIIRSFLKAGYVEDFVYHNTYSGCPQGGVISPILANIYLNELDKKVAEIKAEFDKPPVTVYTRDYAYVGTKIYRLKAKLKGMENSEEKATLLAEISALEKLRRKLPAKSPTDKKLAYVRYADDFLIAVNGSKEDCEQIKRQLAEFLYNEYRLTLSEEKTLITHSSERVRFLGYNISVRRNQSTITDSSGRKKRHLNNSVALTVPFDKIEKFMLEKGAVRQTEAKKFKSIHRKGWLYLPDYEIVERYNAEIRGILNYYCLTVDFNKLSYFAYLMEYSCYATLAGKYDSSISKIKEKYRKGGQWVVQYKTPNGTTKEKRLAKVSDYTNRRCVPCEDTLAKHRWTLYKSASIWARLRAGVCELCGSREKVHFEVHHVPKVKDLNGAEVWEQIMKAKRRKTLIVCEDCHVAIHAN